MAERRGAPPTQDGVFRAICDHYPMAPYECKADDWGRLPDGRVVAVDFADLAHDAGALRDQVQYLEGKMDGR